MDGQPWIWDTDSTPIWRISCKDGTVEPVLAARYTDYEEEDFLTPRIFGTKLESEAWLKEFWQAYWQASLNG